MLPPPAERLKALRERAGHDGKGEVTGKMCAEAWREYKKKHKLSQKGRSTDLPPQPTTWYRYEDVDRMGDKPIPYNQVMAIMPLLLGRGIPPITEDELMSLVSPDRRLGSAHRVPVPERPSLQLVPDVPAVAASGSVALPVKYRAERGAYFERADIASRALGMSAICSAVTGAFAVVIADDHALPLYTPGAVLECVPVTNLADTIGKRVVVFAERPGAPDIGQVVVATVEKIKDGKPVLRKPSGLVVSGEVLGLVLGHYTRD